MINLSLSPLANGQQRDIYNTEGILIYADENRIPQDAIFFKATKSNNQDINDLLLTVLKDSLNTGYIIYFQGIRWMQPNLFEVLTSASFSKGQIEYFDYHILPNLSETKNCKIAYGKVTFDATFKNRPRNSVMMILK